VNKTSQAAEILSPRASLLQVLSGFLNRGGKTNHENGESCGGAAFEATMTLVKMQMFARDLGFFVSAAKLLSFGAEME